MFFFIFGIHAAIQNLLIMELYHLLWMLLLTDFQDLLLSVCLFASLSVSFSLCLFLSHPPLFLILVLYVTLPPSLPLSLSLSLTLTLTLPLHFFSFTNMSHGQRRSTCRYGFDSRSWHGHFLLYFLLRYCIFWWRNYEWHQLWFRLWRKSLTQCSISEETNWRWCGWWYVRTFLLYENQYYYILAIVWNHNFYYLLIEEWDNRFLL